MLKDRQSPDAVLAREAIERLTTKYGIAESEIQMRIDLFRALEHYGSGRLWKERFRISRTKVRLLARRLHDDANVLRSAISPQFRTLFMQANKGLNIDVIPNQIEKAAELLEAALGETSDRGADWTLEPKRELTQFVWRTTGKPLDRLLADLITAILGLDKYTAEEQRKFRERHCSQDGNSSFFPTTQKPDTINRIID
jgi:hypothetical protein